MPKNIAFDAAVDKAFHVREGNAFVFQVYADFSETHWQQMLKSLAIHLFKPLIEAYCILASFLLKKKIGVGRMEVPAHELRSGNKPVGLKLDLTKIDPKDIKIKV